MRCEPDEADLVAGAELAELPEFGCNDRGGADEAAERGPVGTEDYGHVAGEVDGADGVGVVVDVAWMETRFAAVAAGPLRFGADEADAGGIGIVVHFPIGAEEHLDVLGREEVRCAVGAVEHANVPTMRHGRPQGRSEGCGAGYVGRFRCV